MQKLLLLIALVAFPAFAQAKAYSYAEVAANLKACQKFLKLSRAQQEVVSKRTSYSRTTGVRVCRTMVSQGVAKTWKLYQAELRQRHRYSPRQPEAPPQRTCWSNSNCSSGEHCKWGSCTSQSDVCGGDGACVSGARCINGQCVD